MFIQIAIFVAFLLHLLIAYRLSRSAPNRTWKWGIWLGLTVLFVLTASVPLSWVLPSLQVSETVRPYVFWPSSIAAGLYSLLLTLFVIRELGWFGLYAANRLIPRKSDSPRAWFPDDPQRREVLSHTVNVGLLGLTGVFAGAGAYEARRRASVKEVTISIDGLPEALKGFRIAQLSDIHVGPMIKRGYLAAIVEEVNRQKPDLVAITGDLVDGSVEYLKDDVSVLAELQSRHGTYFCTGNHEYYAGVDPWLIALSKLGIRVLINTHEIVEHDGGRLLVAGCTDYRAGRWKAGHKSSPAACLTGAQSADAKVLLAHRPQSVFEASQVGFDLQLSGHTHGGQFIPWNFVVKALYSVSAGLGRRGKTWIYVNPGTGYFGPPVRLGVPSEITLLTLT